MRPKSTLGGGNPEGFRGSMETATNGVDPLGGPRSVAATYDGRDRARPSLMQIKPFNFYCRSNRSLEIRKPGIPGIQTP